jgi:precorrin-3B methylase
MCAHQHTPINFPQLTFNLRSKRRTEQIVHAREIFLSHRDPKTPVGIVTAATRAIVIIEPAPFETIFTEMFLIFGSAVMLHFDRDI